MSTQKFEEISARIGALESRITALEVHHSHTSVSMQKFEFKLDDVSRRAYILEERVNHLPSKGFIVKSLVTTLTLLGLLIAFQGKLRDFTDAQTSRGLQVPSLH